MLILLILLSTLIWVQAEGEFGKAGANAIDIDPTNQSLFFGPPVQPTTCNHPPEQPSLIGGPILSLAAAAGGNYSAYATDPDGDPLTYRFDWGDGNHSDAGPLYSGSHALSGHNWSRAGKYSVRVRATDDENASSPWSSPLEVLVNSPPNLSSAPIGKSLLRPREKAIFSIIGVDPDADPVQYTFDWGDSSISLTEWLPSGGESRAEHSWEDAGSYLVKARATDNKNASSPWSSPLEVLVNSPPDQPSPPIGQRSATPGENISFCLSGVDPDADPVRCILDWDDGTLSLTDWIPSGREARVEHSWKRAGAYLVKARLEDSRNASSPWSESMTIIINTLPNRPDPPSGPAFGYALVPYRYQTSARDPDGDPLNYSFDWGDGTFDSLYLISSGQNASTEHAWNDPGDYRIRIMAEDRMGGGWSEERNITIDPNEQPERPRDLYGVRSGYAGIVYAYFTMARDPDGDLVKYVLDWGDGHTQDTDYVSSGSLENASHRWSHPGEYQVLAGAIDGKGAPSEWSGPFLVSISANDPPERPVVPSGPAAGRCSISHQYATSATDPDGDPVKYIFDWGDGTTSWTGLEFLSSGEERAVSHKWKTPGVYQIKAAALDDKGSISNWSGALLVKMA